MKKFVKASLVAGMLAAPIMADEQFGGIGVTIYQVPAGVYVAEVIPGGPAADTKIKKGDVIVAVDGVSLKGQNIEFSKDQIRGQVDKPVELTYVSERQNISKMQAFFLAILFDEGQFMTTKEIAKELSCTNIKVMSGNLPWSFDADGAQMKLASEAYRISLAHLFDPYLLVCQCT